MRLSKYCFVIRKEDCVFLYNCRTDCVTLIEEDLAEVIQKKDLKKMKISYKAFYDYLLNSKSIVEDDLDECEDVITQWRSEDNSERVFGLYINPTLDCNLRCWYCYEKTRSIAGMKHEVYDTVVRLIDRYVSKSELEAFSLGFFGGEPFMEFDNVVYPLLCYCSKVCCDRGKNFSFSFVSNGTLIDKCVIEALCKIPSCRPAMFQLTLDGNRELHDKTKKNADGSGTYDRLLSTISLLLTNSFDVTLRLNTTVKNVDSFYDVIDDLKNVTEKNAEHLIVDIQQVWQDVVNISPKEFLRKQKQLRNHFVDEGFKVNELRVVNPVRCYADHNNHVVVNYNGDIFSCTARDFNSDIREGVLSKEGKLMWNDRKNYRRSIVYGNTKCRSCNIYPLCHGGCSQLKIDSICNGLADDKCLFGYGVDDKIRIIEERIDFLINSFLAKKKFGNES